MPSNLQTGDFTAELIELRALYYFLALAEELHFGRAARRLNIAQPALSRQIQNLEKDLEFQLFGRTKRQVRLTAGGSVLVEKARPLFAALEATIRSARSAAEGKTGSIRIGFVGSAMLTFLPTVVRSFRQQFPNVALTLSEMTRDEQLLGLQQKRVNVGFVRVPAEPKRTNLVIEAVRPRALGHRSTGPTPPRKEDPHSRQGTANGILCSVSC